MPTIIGAIPVQIWYGDLSYLGVTGANFTSWYRSTQPSLLPVDFKPNTIAYSSFLRFAFAFFLVYYSSPDTVLWHRTGSDGLGSLGITTAVCC